MTPPKLTEAEFNLLRITAWFNDQDEATRKAFKDEVISKVMKRQPAVKPTTSSETEPGASQ